MNWINNQDIVSINNYINTSVYGGTGVQGNGIDIRLEMHHILYGDFGIVPKGHWVVLRKYNRNQRSAYYNKTTHEGVGGPAYTYTDHLLRTRRVPVGAKHEQLIESKVGNIIGDQFIYYFEWTVNPKIGDDIYELDLNDHTLMPNINEVNFIERYKIKRSLPYRLENGNIQYYSAVSIFDETEY